VKRIYRQLIQPAANTAGNWIIEPPAGRGLMRIFLLTYTLDNDAVSNAFTEARVQIPELSAIWVPLGSATINASNEVQVVITPAQMQLASTVNNYQLNGFGGLTQDLWTSGPITLYLNVWNTATFQLSGIAVGYEWWPEFK